MFLTQLSGPMKNIKAQQCLDDYNYQFYVLEPEVVS